MVISLSSVYQRLRQDIEMATDGYEDAAAQNDDEARASCEGNCSLFGESVNLQIEFPKA